jgi:deoxycytidylate deaminase
MSTAREYIVLDECMNCQEEIGATGIKEVVSYLMSENKNIPINNNRYNWVHTGTGMSKCVDRPGMYAASGKMPPQ